MIFSLFSSSTNLYLFYLEHKLRVELRYIWNALKLSKNPMQKPLFGFLGINEYSRVSLLPLSLQKPQSGRLSKRQETLRLESSKTRWKTSPLFAIWEWKATTRIRRLSQKFDGAFLQEVGSSSTLMDLLLVLQAWAVVVGYLELPVVSLKLVSPGVSEFALLLRLNWWVLLFLLKKLESGTGRIYGWKQILGIWFIFSTRELAEFHGVWGIVGWEQ